MATHKEESQQAATRILLPIASVGDTVFVQVGGRNTLAFVSSFDGYKYHVVPRGKSDGVDLWLDDGRGADWAESPPGTCVVCLDQRAGHVFTCKCTAPLACRQCAVRLSACPVCREGGVGSAAWLHRLEDRNSQQRIQVYVVDMRTRKSHTIAVRQSWSIVTLKTLCVPLLATPLDQQRFLFSGKQLSDGSTIACSRIRDQSTVTACVRLCGD
jgi:hypothetical protein